MNRLKFRVGVVSVNKQPKKYLTDTLKNQTENNFEKYSIVSASYNMFLTKVGILLAVASAILSLIHKRCSGQIEGIIFDLSFSLLVICCMIGMTILLACNHRVKVFVKRNADGLGNSKAAAYADSNIRIRDLNYLLCVTKGPYNVMCTTLIIALLLYSVTYFMPGDFQLPSNAFINVMLLLVFFVLVCILIGHMATKFEFLNYLKHNSACIVLFIALLILASIMRTALNTSIYLEIYVALIITVAIMLIVFGHRTSKERRFVMYDECLKMSQLMQRYGVDRAAVDLVERVKGNLDKHVDKTFQTNFILTQYYSVIANSYVLDFKLYEAKKMFEKIDLNSLNMHSSCEYEKMLVDLTFLSKSMNEAVLEIMKYKELRKYVNSQFTLDMHKFITVIEKVKESFKCYVNRYSNYKVLNNEFPRCRTI